jgi:NAD(P)-dependent dehydrogenase (short-subunit alcohol dehydrogenase family)
MTPVNRVVLVTGSSKGIGAAISKRFAGAGYHAVVTYNTSEKAAADVVSSIRAAGGSADACHLDVTSEASVTSVTETILQTWGRLDVLVSNAAVEIAKPVDDASLEEWHTVLLTKLDGAFLCTKHCLPLLQASDNPSIVYVTSSSGERPKGDYLAYEVGTAGLIAMTKANAVYLARKYRIRVNAVSPGPVMTPLWDPLPGTSEEMWVRFNESTPVGRVATDKDVAEACLALTDDPGRFLNGVFLAVDGGRQWI